MTEWASEEEYQNHRPGCAARMCGRLNRERCTCDAPKTTSETRPQDQILTALTGEPPASAREWHCPFCEYGERKDRDDWKLRAARHLTHCEAIDPVLRADAAPPVRIDNGNTYRFCDAVHGRMGRCVRGAGHNGPHAFVLPPYPQLPVMLGEKSS